MMDMKQLKMEILQECKEDHVGLWAILFAVRQGLAGERGQSAGVDPQEARRITLELIREFLQSGLIQAGFPTPDGRGFTPWRMAPDEVLTRVNAEWDALGREPNIGEIVWFTTTEKGDRALASQAAPGSVGG
ncbi:MAG TPA: hypothetical protein VFA26_01160 [Gemmataceae bacterium]|nr:hypothetical protein [Gemmataceae bacterium]